MARPAASSLALLIRRPDDRRCSEVCSEACDVFRLRCAFSEAILVLMVWVMMILQTMYFGSGYMLISLWSVSTFRDNQTAVETGNGCPMGKLRAKKPVNFIF